MKGLYVEPGGYAAEMVLSIVGFSGSEFRRRNAAPTAFVPFPPETTFGSKLGLDNAAKSLPVRTSTTTTAPAS